jgi:serine/threonine protein kinase
MAPERIKREPIDARADLFSLGVVMWETLTGRRLFRGANDVETLKNVLEAEIPVPSWLRPEVPPALDAIVMRALERDATARYSSAHAMVDDLEEVLQTTKHQSKMLPALLQELFGAALQADQVSLSGMTEELFDAPVEPSAERSATTAGASSSIEAAPTSGRSAEIELPHDLFDVSAASLSPSGPVEAGGRRRPVLLAIAALVLIAGLGGLFLRRGRSHATAEPPPSVTAEQPASPPPVEPLVVPSPAAGTAEALAVPPSPSDKPADRGATATPTGEAPSRRSSHSRTRAARDRIVRGLSIDPFAEAGQRGGR